ETPEPAPNSVIRTSSRSRSRRTATRRTSYGKRTWPARRSHTQLSCGWEAHTQAACGYGGRIERMIPSRENYSRKDIVTPSHERPAARDRVTTVGEELSCYGSS